MFNLSNFVYEAKMAKRLLDKKVVKISFTDSPDDQEEYSYDWDVNFSSGDEDIFFKGKSEILWSRTGDQFQYSDSPQSFSDLTGRTLSSCSWHNDEFDMKSTSKVNASLEAIDTALYEKVKSPFMCETVFQECCDWTEKFPYFRIKGEQIIKPPGDNFTLYATNSMGIKQFELRRPNTSLLLEGRKLSLHATNKAKGVYFDCSSDNKVPNCFEELLDEEAFEECFALHESDGSGDNLQVPMVDNGKSISSVKALQEKVLDKLVSEMWPSVVAFLEKLGDKNSISDSLQLPPIVIATEQKRALSLQRPKTEGCSSVNTEFPKLESMLTVSPKILQTRELGNGFVSHIARPNSEMSVNLRLSSKSLKSACHEASSTNIRMKSESVYAKKSRSEREPENMCFILPALEEDFQDTSSFLRGFHIEPGRKDALHKTVLSSRNEYEAVSTSRTSEYFLPPIKDKGYVPANVKLTKNLFTFYGSPVIPDKNKTIGSAKFRNANSRPNTSVSKKTIKSHDVTHQLPVKNGLCITAKNIGKNPSSSNIEMLLGDNGAAVEASQEKSVTLFPIVTSLTPHEDKNPLSKKGLLHSFLGGRKR